MPDVAGPTEEQLDIAYAIADNGKDGLANHNTFRNGKLGFGELLRALYDNPTEDEKNALRIKYDAENSLNPLLMERKDFGPLIISLCPDFPMRAVCRALRITINQLDVAFDMVDNQEAGGPNPQFKGNNLVGFLELIPALFGDVAPASDVRAALKERFESANLAENSLSREEFRPYIVDLCTDARFSGRPVCLAAHLEAVN